MRRQVFLRPLLLKGAAPFSSPLAKAFTLGCTEVPCRAILASRGPGHQHIRLLTRQCGSKALCPRAGGKQWSWLPSDLMFCLQVSRPHPSDHPLLIFFVVGGVTVAEAKMVRDLVASLKPGTQVLSRGWDERWEG